MLVVDSSHPTSLQWLLYSTFIPSSDYKVQGVKLSNSKVASELFCHNLYPRSTEPFTIRRGFFNFILKV